MTVNDYLNFISEVTHFKEALMNEDIMVIKRGLEMDAYNKDQKETERLLTFCYRAEDIGKWIAEKGEIS